jgi:ribosome recycling factor
MSLETVIGIIVSVAVTILAARRKFEQFKQKLTDIREFVDALDDALKDSKITEEEWQALWEHFKKLVAK